jgi:hypothetical protein
MYYQVERQKNEKLFFTIHTLLGDYWSMTNGHPWRRMAAGAERVPFFKAPIFALNLSITMGRADTVSCKRCQHL